MRLLSRLGYRTIIFADLVSLVRQGETLPTKTIVLTFDDGTVDHHRNVLPILKEFGLVATFFVSPGLMGTEKWMIKYAATKSRDWFDDDPRVRLRGGMNSAPRKFSHLSWDEALEMHRAGQEIGSHGLMHSFLTGIPLAEAEREIRLSRELLATRLGKPVRTFCYPFGDWNGAVQGVVRAAGYQGACVTVPSSTADVRFDDLFVLGRVPANTEMPMWAFWLVISGADSLRRRITRLPGMAPLVQVRRNLRDASRRRKSRT
jgi:peptidoglycan/xylan/chitin deacetylase (PgdA/CDA1 family)